MNLYSCHGAFDWEDRSITRTRMRYEDSFLFMAFDFSFIPSLVPCFKGYCASLGRGLGASV